MLIRKILASLIIATFAVIGISACGGSAAAGPTNYDGTYVFTDGEFAMVGEVKQDTILVNLKLGNDTGLYWSGNFKSVVKNGDTITSKANVDQLKTSLYGSQDAAKEFKIVDGKITFSFTMMGVTKTIELEKNSSSTN